MLKADHMRSLPEFFTDVDDPRRRQGLRHPLPTVLAIAAAATLCGVRGYQAMAEWANGLSQRARERFRCRRRRGRYEVPSQYVIYDVLIRVDPAQLDRALQRWNAVHGVTDEALVIDGRILCSAIRHDEAPLPPRALRPPPLGVVAYPGRPTLVQQSATFPSTPPVRLDVPMTSAPPSPYSKSSNRT